MIYLALDDTDNIGTRGTGKLSRNIGAVLSKDYNVEGITRHQLFVHEDIPYTSHNSCAVIHLNESGKDNCDTIFEAARELMLNDFVEGSDPGIAVAEAEQIVAPLRIFGRDAQHIVLTQEKARTLAKNLDIRLEGLGGTEDGVIGTMAGLGLAAGQNDGRYIMRGTIRDITGPVQAEVLFKAGVDAIYTIDGRPVTEGLIHVEEGKSSKPCPVGSRSVLFVEERDNCLHAVKRS